MNNEIRGNILVVDDQDNWRDALADILTREEYTVKTMASFEEARKAILEHEFDLVVLDVRLVDTDIFDIQGLELLQIAKSREPSPKVIIITGYPESIHDGTLEKYGADALILKVPTGSRFDSKGFKEKVRHLLQHE